MTTTEHCHFLTVLLYILNRNRILCTLFIQTIQDNSTMIHINSALFRTRGFHSHCRQIHKTAFVSMNKAFLTQAGGEEPNWLCHVAHMVRKGQIPSLHLNMNFYRFDNQVLIFTFNHRIKPPATSQYESRQLCTLIRIFSEVYMVKFKQKAITIYT